MWTMQCCLVVESLCLSWVQVLLRSRCEKRLRVLQSTAGAPPAAAPGATEGRSARGALPLASHSNIVPLSLPLDSGYGTENTVS